MDERSKGARRSAEYSAKSVAEALARAAEDLGVAPEKLEYEVIKDSSRSLLGLVRTGEAIIRVWLPSEPSAEAEEQIPPQPLEEEALEEEIELAAPKRAKGNPPELEKVACEVVATLLDKMGILAAVEVVDRGGQLDPVTNEVSPLGLNIVGDDLGVLIGRRGETLRDLQFIVRLIISRRLGVWPNVVIDVEGYKARRVKALQTLAQRLAEQVKQTGRPAVLEPMPAHERRIVHLALRDHPDVYTESTGEGDQRKVQILPK
jgi:spoIIIJ-associated protein